jgi:mono/diheme cytochrome c family protein
MSARMKHALLGAVLMLLLLIAIALIVILSGGYNVAATDRHNPIVGWALDTTMHNAVQGAADDVAPAPEFTPAMIAAGATEYKEYCAHCHGGVGEKRAEWAMGMRPHPPALARVADQWSEQELYWIITHGIKMTGMPAFGPNHNDETVWNIAGFVSRLPQMSATEYAAYEGGHEH